MQLSELVNKSVLHGRIVRSGQRVANLNATCAPSCRVSGSPNFDGENVGWTCTLISNGGRGVRNVNMPARLLWITHRRVVVTGALAPRSASTSIRTWLGTSGPPHAARESV